MGRLFLRQNERDYNLYKEEHQDALEQGRCLTFCIVKIVEPSPTGKAFCFLTYKTCKKR
jgi:hypothetical protein